MNNCCMNYLKGMKMKKTIFFIQMLVMSGSPGLVAQAPWQQHGKLEVSRNGHIIQHHDGTPFLWIGDTGWGMIQQLTREEIDYYLDNRQKLGFTVIQTVAFWYPHGGGMESGPHNAANAYGFRPFRGDEDSPGSFKQKEIRDMIPPERWEDAILVLHAGG